METLDLESTLFDLVLDSFTEDEVQRLNELEECDSVTINESVHQLIFNGDSKSSGKNIKIN